MTTFATIGWRDGWYLVPYEVTWRDLDAMGHVNNAVYFTFFEWARTKFWLDLRGNIEPAGIEFIVARAECDFRAELGLLDQIHIGVRIGEIRRTSFDFDYEIRTVTSAEIVATGKVVVVHYSWTARAKILVSAELREQIRLFQQGERG